MHAVECMTLEMQGTVLDRPLHALPGKDTGWDMQLTLGMDRRRTPFAPNMPAEVIDYVELTFDMAATSEGTPTS
jgi:hypothetical protein